MCRVSDYHLVFLGPQIENYKFMAEGFKLHLVVFCLVFCLVYVWGFFNMLNLVAKVM